LVIDLHTHTRWGSACGYMDPSELVQRAKEVGLDGVCITEHNQLWNEEAIGRLSRKHDFLVIGGVEVSTDCGEVLVFGLHEPVLHVYRAEELRTMAERADGVMIAAHPFRGDRLCADARQGETEEAVAQACARPLFGLVEGVEVCNGRSGVWEQTFTRLVAERLGLVATGGSDAHSVLGVGTCVTAIEGTVRTERDLVRAIRERRVRPLNGVRARFPDSPIFSYGE